MTTSRLAKPSSDFESKLTAAEWAALAREKGHLDAAKAWDRRAVELGEERIPNGITVRFLKDGSKERVSIVR
jgi:hypothetical protein